MGCHAIEIPLTFISRRVGGEEVSEDVEQKNGLRKSNTKRIHCKCNLQTFRDTFGGICISRKAEEEKEKNVERKIERNEEDGTHPSFITIYCENLINPVQNVKITSPATAAVLLRPPIWLSLRKEEEVEGE